MKTRLVYLLAASHSGSTLLALLLGAHPEVATVGELKATSLGDLERYRCSCGTPIRQCAFWRGIGGDLARQGLAFDLADAGTDLRSGATPYVKRLLRPLHRGPLLERIRDGALALSPAWRRSLPRIQRTNAALAASVAARTGKPVVVDSSKIGLRLKYLLRNPALDVKVIRLVRDGRAVALTYTDPAEFADARQPALRGGGQGGDRRDERLPMAAAAREWLRSNEEADAALAGLPRDRWTQVSYEGLCADTGGTLRALDAFIGVDPARPRDVAGAQYHVIGNGMRLDFDRQVRLDERWRTALTPADLSAFDAVAGAMNRRLGYR